MPIPGGTDRFQRAAEDIHGPVDLIGRGRRRRNETQHAAVATQAEYQALLEAKLADAPTLVRRRRLGVPVAHQLDARQLTAPADIADQLVALAKCFESVVHLRADRACPGRNVFLLHDIETGDAGGADEGIVAVRVRRRVARGDDRLLDLGGRRHGADPDAATEMLGDGDDVGNDAVALETEHRAELAEAGLLLVDDEQHAALDAELLETPQPTRRRLDHAAGAEQGLGDDRRRPTRALRIQQLEAGLEAGELAFGKTLRERAAIAIRGDDCVGAPRQMAVTGVPTRKGDGARGVRKAMKADMRARD